jgi:L,D-transpeptidase YcbB
MQQGTRMTVAIRRCGCRLARGACVVGLALLIGTPPAAAFITGANGFRPFTDSGPMTEKDWARLRRQREALYQELAPAYQMQVPMVSEAAIAALQQAIARYQQIVAQGGWPSIDPQVTILAGDSNVNVLAIRRHLAIEGDLPADNGSAKFDQGLVRALARFQIRNGLSVTGFIDRRTAQVLNIPAQQRLQQLQTNLQRLQDLMTINKADRYVLVDIPAYTVQAVDHGQLALSSNVVVGRPTRPTPILDAHIVEINFYPIWRVPDSVAHKDLIPELQRDPSYFQKEHFSVMTAWHTDPLDPATIDWSSPEVESYKFRQDPGPFNALGVVRINMPNTHDVYMHDTPLKQLFDESTRAFSSGCVRVQKVVDLVGWLLSAQKGWDAEKVQQTIADGQSVNVKLRHAVPVHFVYLTAWAQQDGIVQFRPDIYGQDAVYASDNQDPGNAVYAEQRSAITP